VVKVGDRVKVGDLIGDIPGDALGSRIHASIDGVVREVSDAVVIETE
jgi:Na+-translocating ferredoxin:NAD+ oxidoreductase RnfC subunit